MAQTSRTAIRRLNSWIESLSPGGYAALMASGITLGQATGIMVARWQWGEQPSYRWYGVLAIWLACFLLFRLIAPVVLRTMRLQRQWREERHQQSEREPGERVRR